MGPKGGLLLSPEARGPQTPVLNWALNHRDPGHHRLSLHLGVSFNNTKPQQFPVHKMQYDQGPRAAGECGCFWHIQGLPPC